MLGNDRNRTRPKLMKKAASLFSEKMARYSSLAGRVVCKIEFGFRHIRVADAAT